MKNHIYIFLTLVLALYSMSTKAQLASNYSQYLQNMYTINQAYAGVQDGMEGGSSFRRQWVGIPNGPRSGFVNFYGAIGKPKKRIFSRNTLKTKGLSDIVQRNKVHHGVGGILVYDQAGAFIRYSGKVSWAVHVPLTSDITMSVAPSVGISTMVLRQSMVEFIDPNDPSFSDFINNNGRRGYFDMNMGMWLYSKKAFLGYSVEQIFKNQFKNTNKLVEGELNQFHYVTTGYRFNLPSGFYLTPSVLARISENIKPSIDINAKVEYLETFWGGITYRHDQALVIMGGLMISDAIKFGYSYDYHTNRIQKYGSGSHEIYLGILLNQNK
jgi:type IX secretion system PorP/SprF family membrane protein